MKEFFAQLGGTITSFLANAGLKLLAVVAALIFGITVIKIIKRVLKKVLLRSPLDTSLVSFVLSIINFLLYFVLLMILAKMLEIPTTSFIALLSAVGLAVSLAIQGSLSNLANGIIIISTKPFKVGDFVELAGISGTVKSIKMMHTKLETTDNKVISVPNSEIINSSITNYNSNALRRVDIEINVAYGSNVEEVKALLMTCITEHPLVLTTPDPLVRMKMQGDSSLVFVMRMWCKSEHYWNVYFDINERTYEELTNHNIEIPFNQLDVHIKDINANPTVIANDAIKINKSDISIAKQKRTADKKDDKQQSSHIGLKGDDEFDKTSADALEDEED